MQTLDEKIRISKLLYKEALKDGKLSDIEKEFILLINNLPLWKKIWI